MSGQKPTGPKPSYLAGAGAPQPGEETRRRERILSLQGSQDPIDESNQQAQPRRRQARLTGTAEENPKSLKILNEMDRREARLEDSRLHHQRLMEALYTIDSNPGDPEQISADEIRALREENPTNSSLPPPGKPPVRKPGKPLPPKK
jgi:hypothetical protein